MKKINLLLSLLLLLFLVISCSQDQNLEDYGPSVQVEGLNDSQEYLQSDEDILKALDLKDAEAQQRSFTSQKQSSLYTIGNEVQSNEVLVFNRNSDGTLIEAGRYATGGQGTGGGLGNQGALALSDNKLFLFTVNPGSDDFSFFYIRKNGSLKLIDKVQSGGIMPVSITYYHGLIYVLNAGGTGNIAAFAVNHHAQLVELSNSRRALSSEAAGAAQISFSGNGKAVVITEKATNTLTSFAVDASGRPGTINTFPSAGVTPFGFSFGRANVFHVSEAFGGEANASTVSSYHVNTWGKISLLDGPFPTNGSAACWVATSRDGRYLFVTNTASNDVTSLSTTHGGELNFANNGNSTPTGTSPIDAAMDSQSKFLYVLSGGDDAIVSYKVGEDGALDQIDEDTGLPDRASGLVVR
jgi:6-phosphogluconolactonase (cycloisomerase 2 family)